MNILLTGGAGYIGSHCTVALSEGGHKVVLLDNFFNSRPGVLRRLGKILGAVPLCINADVRDTDAVEKVLRDHKIDAVIHLAGLKSVGDSVTNPLEYYANNVQGSISLLDAMKKVGVRIFVFSSSATVYGNPMYLPYDENHPTKPMNPYGQSKLQVEEILMDLSASDPKWKIASLRYFNPVGAHQSGLIGEDPNGIPNNLMPYVAKVAAGEIPHLNIFGSDYETKDGTGERDYIHVMDLAEGHFAALDYIQNNSGMHVFNLGTGNPISVLDLVHAFEKASSKKIPIKMIERRDGDLPIYYAKAELAKNKLQWISSRDLDSMCLDTWRWQESKNSVGSSC